MAFRCMPNLRYPPQPITQLAWRARLAMQASSPVRRLVDFIVASILFALPITLRKQLFAGEHAFCPLCHSHLSGFLTLNRPYHRWCPVCRSLQRHRLIWLLLERFQLITPEQPQTMLHFAPEPGLARRFAQMPHLRYVTADLFDPSVMMRFDITTIPFDDHAFDLILCSHVLEHVPNDRQAMRELYRVLKSGGIALIVVPIQGERTFEDATITDPLLRERYFGQFDHVRMYGTDIIQRLQQAGFYVQEISVRDIIITQDEIERMGLPVNETVFVCRKEDREVRLAS